MKYWGRISVLMMILFGSLFLLSFRNGGSKDHNSWLGNLYRPADVEYFLSVKKVNFIRPGLNITVEDIQIPADLRPEVTISLFDDRGQPLDRDGKVTPGGISINMILAWYDGTTRRYTSYVTRTVTSNITGNSAIQADRDRSGSWEDLEVGRAVYKFGNALPEDYDGSRTHTLAMYAERDLEDFIEKSYFENLEHDFRPDGGEVTEVWEGMATATCNNCHDPLALHGGARRDVKLCITCHNPGSTDPDTGNTIDMAVMIHKIHRGEDLPSVQAGTPYRIIGFRNSVHDYSHVVFPQDVRNCTSCHPDSSPEGHIWFTRPTRTACGSCHDNVDWVTGEGHKPGPAPDDSECAGCHAPEGEAEFDASIMGAHTIPGKSRQLAGMNIEILEVTNTGPARNPTVRYTVKNNAGETVDPASLPFFNLLIAGPSEDFTFLANERAVEGSVADGDGFTYTFNAPLPEDEGGTYRAGAEAFRMVTLNPGTEKEIEQRETAENPVYDFVVGDGELKPRRFIVSDEKCESCHENLALHGDIRHNTEYCVMCHQPAADDSPFRPEDELPARTIDFKFMVHRIHMGEELSRDYTLTAFQGTQVNFNEVLYPGDLRNCGKCHVDDSYHAPSPGIEVTIDPNEFFSPIPPTSAACLGCHDTRESASHAFVNTAPFGEACGACHGEDREFSVPKEHAR